MKDVIDKVDYLNLPTIQDALIKSPGRKYRDNRVKRSVLRKGKIVTLYEIEKHDSLGQELIKELKRKIA